MAEEKISAEAKKVLREWQAKGIKFSFDGKVAEIANFSFSAKYYGIANQALPKEFHNEKGLKELINNGVAITDETCIRVLWPRTLFASMRILAQGIPSEVLNIGKEEIPKLPDKVAKIMRPKVESDPKITTSASPLERQPGGEHYVGRRIQPVEFIHANDIPFLEGCVIKRMTRWRNKPEGGIGDLRKAIHEIELLIHLEENK